MIFTEKKKEIRVMFTPFRDGLQSVFGGKTRLNDILPAIEASAAAGIRHFEFGGGARFQAPFFYVGEDPFKCMAEIRKTVGPDADLQILTRSVSGVTLTTQRTSTLALQAKLMHKHGTTIDRNFDFMNDVDNLVKTGQPIVDSGMHHQVCVALMGLPFKSDKAHTPEFYINIVRELLKRDIHFDSVCLKDASGTTDPHTCYETAKGIKAILPPEIPLVQHTHDTASTAVACYMAGIAGGVDSIDLAVRPLASGTSQPDVRSMAHALKGTGYSLDIDPDKMDEIESILNKGLSEYEFNPVTTSADARVVGFPMPGGAIGPNVHMMKSAGILDKYSEVYWPSSPRWSAPEEAGPASPREASSTGCRRSITSSMVVGKKLTPATANQFSATLVDRRSRPILMWSRLQQKNSRCRRSTATHSRKHRTHSSRPRPR